MKETDQKIAQISDKISFLYMNPTNVEKEKRLFLSNKEYSPQFRYSKQNFDGFKKILDSLKTDDSTIGKLLRQKIDEKYILIDMIESRGLPAVSKYSKLLYGSPSKELINKAKKIIEIRPVSRLCQYSSTQTISLLRKIIVDLGINWHVRIKDMIADAAVSVPEKTLFIKKNSCFSDKQIRHVVVHEIGTHILRAVNAAKQPYKLFQIGFPSYLKTEEGLAMVNDEINKTMNPSLFQGYAARAVAVDVAKDSSFREVFDYLKQFFDDEKAFRITTRVKRGLADTSEPGGCTKDYLYMQGYYEMKEYIKKNKNTDKLYYGKIGIEHVPLLKNIPGIVEPRFL